jgi:hypothetical protein
MQRCSAKMQAARRGARTPRSRAHAQERASGAAMAAARTVVVGQRTLETAGLRYAAAEMWRPGDDLVLLHAAAVLPPATVTLHSAPQSTFSVDPGLDPAALIAKVSGAVKSRRAALRRRHDRKRAPRPPAAPAPIAAAPAESPALPAPARRPRAGRRRAGDACGAVPPPRRPPAAPPRLGRRQGDRETRGGGREAAARHRQGAGPRGSQPGAAASRQSAG